MITKKQIKEICNKNIQIMGQFVESPQTSEIMKIGALQQQIAIMRVCDELLNFYEENSRQDNACSLTLIEDKENPT